MTVSPKKTIAVKSTVSRGVEAKNIRESDSPIEMNRPSAHPRREGSGAGDGDRQSPSFLSASYVQVVVQKHQRPPARLPVASSPNKPVGDDERVVFPGQFVPVVYQCQCGPGRLWSEGPARLWSEGPARLSSEGPALLSCEGPGGCVPARLSSEGPARLSCEGLGGCGPTRLSSEGPGGCGPGVVLFSCPALAALHQETRIKNMHLNLKAVANGLIKRFIRQFNLVRRASGCALCRRPHRGRSGSARAAPVRSHWQHCQRARQTHRGPDRIEVYHCGGGRECGASCARVVRGARGMRETRVERFARGPARRASALLNELLAAPRLMLQLPVAIVLRVQSCVLLTVRGAVAGAVQTASEQLLQPALALLLDALLRPTLLSIARLATALRHAARPLWLALGDALEPLARLLAQLRLVNVEHRCGCERAV